MYSILDKSDKSEFMTGYGFNIRVWDEDCLCISDKSKVEFIKNHGVSILKENDIYDQYLKASNSGKLDIIDALEVDEQRGFWAVFASVVTNETNCLILFGSSIEHSNSVRLTIKRASVSRNLNSDHFFGEGKLIEVEMSQAVYADKDYIVKLEILADALRSSATSRKCRCNKAKVLEIQNIDGSKANIDVVHSTYDSSFQYKTGQIVEEPKYDNNRFNECSKGIHFFINRQEAVDF